MSVSYGSFSYETEYIEYIANRNTTFNSFLVVAKNGNDVNVGGPYLTIGAAIAYVNSQRLAPCTIFIYPGTYAETGLVIPNNVAIRGSNSQAVIIGNNNVANDTTVIGMGSSTRIEDVTIQLGSTNNFNLIGVFFPLDTPSTAKIRTCVINVTSSGVNTQNVFGVFANGATGGNPFTYSSSNAIRATTINVTATSTAPIARGIYVTGACNFCIRDTNVLASGTAANIIGVENTNAGAFVQLRTSTISGTTFDIMQPRLEITAPSTIQLSSTDLVNANADANGFSVNIEPSHLFFCVDWNSAINFNTSHYLVPGTVAANRIPADGAATGINFFQRVTIFGALVTVINPDPAEPRVLTVNFRKTTTPALHPSGEIFATITLPINAAQTNTGRFQNRCSTFNAVTDFLQIECTTTGTLGNTNFFSVCIDIY